jgi:uncharacterized protein YjbJ (UPF0337 family)
MTFCVVETRVKLNIMSQETYKGNWNVIKGKLKQTYADLTEDDVMYAEGKEDEILGRIQKKVGKTKQEIKDQIDSWLK